MALTFTDDQTATLLNLLGLPADTMDVDTVIATIQDLVTDEQNEDTPGGQRPSGIAAAAKRVGLDVIDTASLEVLRRDAAEGRTLKASVERQGVETKVDDAIRKGKITAGRRKHWVNLIGADPGMADVLAAVPNETAVPLSELGHGVDSEGDPLAQTAEWFR